MFAILYTANEFGVSNPRLVYRSTLVYVRKLPNFHLYFVSLSVKFSFWKVIFLKVFGNLTRAEIVVDYQKYTCKKFHTSGKHSVAGANCTWKFNRVVEKLVDAKSFFGEHISMKFSQMARSMGYMRT